MAWYCLTHTTGGLAAGVEAPTVARRLQWVWALVVLIWRASRTAIRPMTWGGDERPTAESAAQRLRNSGCWRGIDRGERDATARPRAVSRTDSSVSTRQIVAVAGWLRSPRQQTPRHSQELKTHRVSLQGNPGELHALGSPTGILRHPLSGTPAE